MVLSFVAGRFGVERVYYSLSFVAARVPRCRPVHQSLPPSHVNLKVMGAALLCQGAFLDKWHSAAFAAIIWDEASLLRSNRHLRVTVH